MAVIFEGKNQLKEKSLEYEKKRNSRRKINRILLFVLLCSLVLSFAIYDLMMNYIVWLPSIILLLIISFNSIIGVSKNYIDSLGYEGEQKALNVLSRLDDNCTIFHSIDIPFDGKISQLDNILICKNGVFVIEVKNMNSHIIGSYNDRLLTQKKVGMRGGEYESTFYNPIKQVGTHIYRLSNLLRQHGVNPYINGMVFFVNNDVSLDIRTDKIPVFDIYNTKELFNYILSFPANLDTKNRNQICNVLKQYL